MTGFIDIPLGDAVEKDILPEGQYELIIDNAEEREDGRGINCRCSVDGEPNAKAIFHSIWFPDPDGDAEKRNNTLLFAKAFTDAFEIPTKATGFNLEDFFGSRGRVKLTQEEYEGVTSNRIKLAI